MLSCVVTLTAITAMVADTDWVSAIGVSEFRLVAQRITDLDSVMVELDIAVSASAALV
jgi:hypothetical protein